MGWDLTRVAARHGTALALLLAIGLRAATPAAAGHQDAREEESSGPPPLRDLPKEKGYELRALYLEDPRLPTLDASQVRELHRKAERLLKQWYGYRVRIRDAGRRDLAAFFAGYDKVFEDYREGIRGVDLDPGLPKDRPRIRAAIEQDFRRRDLSLIEAYLRVGKIKSKAEAGRIAYDRFLKQLDEIRTIPLKDGKAFWDPARARLHSYAYWNVLQYEVKEADVLLTNSMIFGADAEMPIYVIARGGVSTGNTNNNAHNTYQGAVMVGLFPFLSDAPVFLRERGKIQREELLDVIATFWMHELGHLFLRYAEHYDHPRCVHVAPKWLNYVDWHREIGKGGPCRLEHKRMTRY